AVIRSASKEQVIADIRYRSGSNDSFYQMEVIPTTFEGGETGLTVVLEDITERKRYVKNMEFLAMTGRDFQNMGEEDDIYDYVARQVYSLAPGFLAWVNILDEPNRLLVIKGIAGNPIAFDTMHQLAGMKPLGMTFPISTSETAALIQHQKLVSAPPLFRLLHMQVPEEDCRQIEESSSSGIDSYLMGLVSKGRIVGDVGIGYFGGQELPNRELIEAFIRQAAIAIDRKIAEDGLRQSLAREQEQVTIQRFLARTAMELVDLPTEADIYQYVADRLAELVPGIPRCYVESYDEVNHQFLMRAIVGPEIRRDMSEIAGHDVVGTIFPIKEFFFAAPFFETPSTFRDMRELHFRPFFDDEQLSFYDVCIQRFTREAAEEMVRRARIAKLFLTGLVWQEQLFGMVGICLGPDETLDNKQAIESFLRQASIAIARRQTEDRLRRSDQRFHELMEVSPVPAALISSDGRYIHVNGKFTEMFGYTLQDIPTGKAWLEQAFPDPISRKMAIAARKADLETASSGPIRPRLYQIRCKGGHDKMVRFQPAILSDGTHFVTYETDVPRM
ncbi:MAG: PAS domain S-box protein, partial [Methanobacteriota archaeon]